MLTHAYYLLDPRSHQLLQSFDVLLHMHHLPVQRFHDQLHDLQVVLQGFGPRLVPMLHVVVQLQQGAVQLVVFGAGKRIFE